MISGQGDIAMAVSAIKNGALDFIEKPFRGSEIVARLDEAIGAYARRQAESSASKSASLHFPGREPLTRREREVLEQFTSGASNKEAGRHLGISPRTIEDHRANIMKKLGARNAADLIRIVMTAVARFLNRPSDRRETAFSRRAPCGSSPPNPTCDTAWRAAGRRSRAGRDE